MFVRVLFPLTVPPSAQQVLLQDAIARDLATARRAALLEILWHVRYLNRSQLMTRVEAIAGPGCFGKAWQDVFYRDLRVVKAAFKAAGFDLTYSRQPQRSGYYLRNQPALSQETRDALKGSLAELDLAQLRISGRLSPRQRFFQGCSIGDLARETVAYRLRQRSPALSPAEARRLALQVERTR